jgi:hypothetical protein
VWAEPKIESLIGLISHLKKTYPGDHKIKIIHSGSHLLERSEIIKTTFDTLLTTTNIELWKRPTLYVPPINN